MEKVLVGLSGGVDSTAVALLLKEKGYDVHGVYLDFCPGEGERRARYAAEKLGIPFTVAKRKRRFFHRVVQPFAASYESGLTPNPCVECNRCMKFACLLEEANRLGIEKVATGHYAALRRGEDGRVKLCRGKDRNKDQSYFLWKLTQKQLSRILFPLAGEEKGEVKERAKAYVSPEEKESMEICFIPDGDTGAFLESRCDSAPGDFVDVCGRVLGRHKGLVHYTVGQRRGLGIAMGERYFVLALSPEKNEVILGKESELYVREVRVKNLHFVSCRKKQVPCEGLGFRGRNRGEPIPCTVDFTEGGAVVRFAEPVRRYAPGQSACFYFGDELLFGGEICLCPPKTVENTVVQNGEN